MLNSILDVTNQSGITFYNLMVCTCASIIMGIIISFVHMYKNRYSKNFIITLALLPAIIQMVIMLVNGNLGTGVAVMGAFSLIRFRSAPGNSREIGSIFLAMAIGLSTGMGYIGIACIFLIIVGVITIILNSINFGRFLADEKELKITIPENLDYNNIFDDIFEKYTSTAKLLKVRTANMGSLFELKYNVILKNSDTEKKFIDELRCRNGNLTIVCGRIPDDRDEL